MLRKNVVFHARPVVQGLIKRGIGLEALDDTPLADSVETSLPGLNDEELEVIAQAEDTTPVVLQAVADTAEVSQTHALVNDALIDQGKAAVARVLANAQNVVIPAISEVVDGVVKGVEIALNPPNDITVYRIHPLGASRVVYDLMASYQTGADLAPISDFPILTSEQLQVYLETGSAETNNVLLDYLAGFPENYLEVLQNDLIRGSVLNAADGYVPLLRYEGSVPVIRRSVGALPALAVVCVLLNNLYDNPPAGTPVSISVWNDRIATALSGLGSVYVTLMEDVALHVASRVVYLPSTLRQGEDNKGGFPVLDRVYDAFLEAGGFPELLFALTVGRPADNMISIEALLAQKEELNAAWLAYYDAYRQNALSTITERARDLALQGISTLIGRLDLSELGVDPETLWQVIRDNDARLSFTREDLYTTVRWLVAGVVFAKYQTLPLIEALDACMTADCTPRVAAYHATKQYICDWTLEQLTKQ